MDRGSNRLWIYSIIFENNFQFLRLFLEILQNPFSGVTTGPECVIITQNAAAPALHSAGAACFGRKEPAFYVEWHIQSAEPVLADAGPFCRPVDPQPAVAGLLAALYDAVARCVRGGEPMPWKRFWQTFRRELPCAALVTAVWGGLLWLLAWALGWIWAAAAAGNAAAPLVLVFCLVLLVLPVGAACWMFPLLSRFTFRPVGLMLTALRLAVGCLPRTVGLVLIIGVSALLVRMLLIPVVILPGAAAWLFAALLEPVFRRYQPEDAGPEEAQEPQESEKAEETGSAER